MGHAQLINRAEPEPLLLKQAAITAAADTDPNQLPQLAPSLKDINQDLPVLLLINPEPAVTAQDLLEDLEAPEVDRLADTDLTPQEDPPEVLLAVLPEDGVLPCPWTRAQVQNPQAANMLLQRHAKKKPQGNSKTSKISKRIKSLKSSAHLIRAINKAFVMKTMKAGAHAKAAATNGCRAWAKSSLFALKP